MAKKKAVKRAKRLSAPRGSIWINRKLKKFQAWKAMGSYSHATGDRMFTLTNVKSGTTHAYESPEAAKADGWRIKK